jgi:predicted anti-sigma-YlaC factor YlaD
MRRSLMLAVIGGVLLSGCSIRKFAIRKLGDALSESGATYASDDDPDLVRDALPFALKLIESLLAQSPDHRGLLLAASSGFTQYSYAFIQEEADEQEDTNLPAASALRDRARRLYRRARDYGRRGLEVDHPGFGEALGKDPEAAMRMTGREDVPFLYWTAAAWGALISLGKDDPDLIADLPKVGLLSARALELDETFDGGSLHELMISFEGGRSDTMGGSAARAREHFRRALELSGEKRASPLVALAETVSVKEQNRGEFESLLRRALAVDPDAKPEWRLANLVMQRRARWLLSRADLLFLD